MPSLFNSYDARPLMPTSLVALEVPSSPGGRPGGQGGRPGARPVRISGLRPRPIRSRRAVQSTG